MLIRCPKCGKRGEVEDEPLVGGHLLCPFCSEKFSYAGDAMILAICPQCGSSVELAKDKEGLAINCKQCGFLYVAKHCDLSKLDILSQEAAQRDEPVKDEMQHNEPQLPPKKDDSASPVEESAEMIETKCPNCGTVYEIAEEKIGEAEKCDICGEVFIVKKREKNKIPEEESVVLVGGLRIIGPKKQTANPTKSQSRPQAKSAPKIKITPRVISIKPRKKFCRECGKELNSKAVICPNCGCGIDSADDKDARQKNAKPVTRGCLPAALFFLSWFFVAMLHNWVSVAISVACAFIAVMMCVYNRLYSQMEGQTTIGDVFRRLGIGGSSIFLIAFTLCCAFLMHSCDRQAKEDELESLKRAKERKAEIERNGGWTHNQKCPDCHFENLFWIRKGEDPYRRQFRCESCGHWMKYNLSIW